MKLLLFLHLLERVGFLISTAFVLSRSKWMRSYMDYANIASHHWRFVALFSFFSILGTYSGINVYDFGYHPESWIDYIPQTGAIANASTVGIVIGGLLGGIKPGLLVGLITGIHRYSLGGFADATSMVSFILQGIFAGMMKSAIQNRNRQFSSVAIASMIGFIAEASQMAIVAFFARPVETARNMVELVAVPQILSTSIGVGLFFMLYIQIKKEEERVGSEIANKVLRIADMTLPQWMKPLEEATKSIAKILVQETNAVGVLFTRQGNMMAMEGKETDYSLDLEIGSEKNRIGVFQMYYEQDQDLNAAKSIVLVGLAQLLTQQYAFVQSEKQAQLLADAEIRALQAQMNPHFLFNVLNTVKSFIRTKPQEAREMVTQLGKFLRQNMHHNDKSLISINEELQHVEAYLHLIKPRMGNRLEVTLDIDEQWLESKLPPFSIQPLVENAIEHGLKHTTSDGKIIIKVNRIGERTWIVVEDNGSWIERESSDQEHHAGIALRNIQQRLQFHFGADSDLLIEKGQGNRTRVSFWVK